MTTTEVEMGGLEVGKAHEPSYYEIALTNRQVVVAFVILLTCLVAAFLSGVWIGRESGVRAQEKLALLHASGAAGDPATADGKEGKEKVEGQALQEFKFFADSRRRAGDTGHQGQPASATPPSPARDSRDARDVNAAAGPAENDAAPAAGFAAPAGDGEGGNGAAADTGNGNSRSGVQSKAGSTLADDLHRRTHAEGSSAASTPPVPSRSAAAKSAAVAATAVEPPGAPRSAKSTTSSSSSSTTPAAAKVAASSAVAGAATDAASGDVVIQVFSSADKDQADKVRDTLVGGGFQAYLSPLTKAGQTMYRVRIGPFTSRAGAEPVAEKVRKEQKLDTWITPK